MEVLRCLVTSPGSAVVSNQAPQRAIAFVEESSATRDMEQTEDELIIRQGVLKKQGGWMGSLWQNRAVALTSRTPSKPATLLYADIASDSDDLFVWNGCISLSSSSVADATPGSGTDITLSNVHYDHKSSKKNSIVLRAETQKVRDEWIAAINSELRAGKTPAPVADFK